MNELYDKETIYDDEISPLVKKIIDICNEHRIPMVASFSYENDLELGIGRCTSYLKFEGREDDVNRGAHLVLMNVNRNLIFKKMG